MEKSFIIDEKEYFIGKIEKILRNNDSVEITTDSTILFLPLNNFRDPKYLKKIKKGDEIIYTTDEGCIGINEMFFPVYEMKFGV